MAAGKVWLVGAGPGDPGLLTVRGRELLERAEVVLYDALSHPALLEHCPQAELVNVGKRYARPSPSQPEITGQLLELARAGKRVVRLKGGDPLLFARGGEEALALAEAGVDFEIVPGIASPVAAAAYAGISITHRELSSSVTYITGSDRAGKEWSPEAWRKLATATDTICVLMGMRRLREITEAIVSGGRAPATPVAVIQWGARPRQRVVLGTLADISARVKEHGVKNPAVVVVGDVVRLREQLRWYDNRPLFGQRILVPRPVHQAATTARAIRERAAEPVVFPMIRIADPPEPERLSRAARDLGSYDWVLFTSANGVDRTFLELERQRADARRFGAARVGVIGPKTGAALRSHGVRPDLVAEEFVGEGLVRALLAASETPPRRVLIPRALVAREELPQLLRAAGVEVDVVPAYQTLPREAEAADELYELLHGGVDVAIFTSSSTVSATVELLGEAAAEALSQVTVASIGPITSNTARALGVKVDVTAERYTVAGLLDALESNTALASSP